MYRISGQLETRTIRNELTVSFGIGAYRFKSGLHAFSIIGAILVLYRFLAAFLHGSQIVWCTHVRALAVIALRGFTIQGSV